MKARYGVGRQFGGKRHQPGVMNKTETRFAERLQLRKLAGEIVDWQFEALKFRLGDNVFFTPDFLVLYLDGSLEFIDVKGSGIVDDKSIVKVKVAAERFWMFTFAVEKEIAKKHGGGWKRIEY